MRVPGPETIKIRRLAAGGASSGGAVKQAAARGGNREGCGFCGADKLTLRAETAATEGGEGGEGGGHGNSDRPTAEPDGDAKIRSAPRREERC